ncbi:MAG: GNAT family N-acetyltransferase [Saprospiraceae bacterium]|jgi:RimJ/RimL family protein N-acetyltransferase|nr:GNAT family N-acetyltransferase [Saprospiraceae bacterium]
MNTIVADKSHIEYIKMVEDHPDNKDFIGAWTIEEHLEALQNDNYQHLVFEVEQQLVGYCILQDLIHPDHSILLKRFAIDVKGKGYGYQAVEGIKQHVFTHLQPNRLWLDVRYFNERAMKLYEKANFRKEGIFKKASLMDDQYVDLHIYAMLREEYEKYT